ncbi:hypothetical protein KKI24_09705 [bacterium]|nr:hypothetical protein [bacterium]
MTIDEKTRSILTDKLKFTSEQVHKLENNAGLLARTLNLLSMARRSTQQPEIRKFVQVQLTRIKQTLDTSPYVNNRLLLKARAEYYTFQRS